MRWAATHLWCNSYIETILHHESEKLRFLSMLAPPERNAEMIGFVRWGNHRWVICKITWDYFMGYLRHELLCWRSWYLNHTRTGISARIEAPPPQQLILGFIHPRRSYRGSYSIWKDGWASTGSAHLLGWRNSNTSCCGGETSIKVGVNVLVNWRNHDVS